MQDLKVSLIQSEIIWENIKENLSLFSKKIDQIDDGTDLIILPEMFTTGFSMNASLLAEDMGGSGVTWLKSVSLRKRSHVVGSMIIGEKNLYYNRLVWASPDGDVFTYDKRHLFRYAGEEKVYSGGKKHLTLAVKGWKIRTFICYDLRFPVWTRNFDKAYDVALFIANWPKPRSAHWKTLLSARAIENQSYVIGVNRVGKDGNGSEYSGDSSIIDPKGTVLFQKEHEPWIQSEQLSYTLLERYRREFPAWKDADSKMVLKQKEHLYR